MEVRRQMCRSEPVAFQAENLGGFSRHIWLGPRIVESEKPMTVQWKQKRPALINPHYFPSKPFKYRLSELLHQKILDEVAAKGTTEKFQCLPTIGR